jgi:serralysin
MPAVTSAPPSGNPDIDGLLMGVKWAITGLTYSFPTSGAFYGSSYTFDNEPANNFAALNSVQQSVARTALAGYATVAAITFSEVTESSTVHGDLRLAESDEPPTAWGYYPHPSGAGGDSWFNNSSGNFDNPVRGNYAYHAFMHELGHNFGLEHGHDGSDGDAMLIAHDSMEYSVMTYRSYQGQGLSGGYTNETWGFAQTLMMYDIAALQHLYGANYGSNAGNTTYTWDPATGESLVNGVGQGAAGANRVFMTLWDGGGSDTYDFSNYGTTVTASLAPGGWTTMSQVQRAALGGGNLAAGNVANALLHNGDARSLIENLSGGSAGDTLTGNQAANVIHGNAGNDTLSGGGGNDRLEGGAGSDDLFGGAGNDALIWTSGVDVLDGGSGSDTADFSSFGAAILVNLNTPANYEVWTKGGPTLASGSYSALADVANVENIISTAFADEMYGNGSDNTFVYTAGVDFFHGGGGSDTVDFSEFGAAILVNLNTPANFEVWTKGGPTLATGSYSGLADVVSVENIVGTAFDDEMYGNGSDNTVIYTGGIDFFHGGSGTDTADFSGFGAAILVNLNTPSNYEVWTKGGPTLATGSYSGLADVVNVENIAGTAFADEMYGNDSRNVFSYTGGFDFFHGGGGADTADFSRFGSAVWASLAVPVSNTEVWTKDLPTLSGGTWRAITDLVSIENLTGTAFADDLRGNAGVNRLEGGAGSDDLTGGGGADTFYYGTPGDGGDTIADFTLGGAGDVLDIRDVLVGYDQGSSAASSFVNLAQSGGNTIVSVNADGIGGDFVHLATLQDLTGALLNDMLAQGNLLLV